MTEAELIKSIHDAFKNVTLEEGTGLYEADCIDDYINPNDPVYFHWKQKDERVNWQNLLPILLTNIPHERIHSGNFLFMDAKGKRFHLPCYLLQDLHKRFEGNNPLITVLNFTPVKLSDFDILNAPQEQIIIDFLNYKIKQFVAEENDFDMETYTNAKKTFLDHLFEKTG